MGRLAGKVALITGAARGQGRAHALRLAEEGADIVAVDVCRDLDTVPYPLATPDDLRETARLVEERDRRVLAREVDVRDLPALRAVAAEAVVELGRLDIVVANAGIGSFAPTWRIPEATWREVIDVNLTGVWKTTAATVPHLIEGGRGGSVIITSSLAGLVGGINLGHYAAAKAGVIGLMRTLAVELAPHRIRANTLHPTGVDTPMIDNDTVRRLFLPMLANPTKADAAERMTHMQALPIPWVTPRDVSDAVLFLASDEARYITGVTLPVDAGAGAPYKLP